MSLETFVAGRYLRAKRQESFISVIAGFSLVGIGLGVATLIIVMSVMNGFRHELIGGMLGINGHINVYAKTGNLSDYDYQLTLLRPLRNIVTAMPVVEGQALMTYGGSASGVMVRGLTAADFLSKPLLKKSIESPGQMKNFKDNNILIGSEMAKRLHIGVGDVLTLISPKPKNTPFGSMPRSKAYTIGGIFNVGMFEFNNSFIFMPLETAQSFFEIPNNVSMIEITTTDMQNIEAVLGNVRNKLGSDVIVRGWQESNTSFFHALDVERNVMFLILMLIILIAAFNIISSLIMLVKDKSRDIAILRTMGASKGQVLRIFLITGASIGTVGTLAGALLGILVTMNLGGIQHVIESITHSSLFPAEVYFLTRLPAIIDWHEVLTVIFMALALSFGATIYPAWRAAKLDPVEALRFG
ncbi:MAG: lipoprotein-releasing transporter permease subunit [Alphaproteobacteria bacterium]|nr:lipoprotein-releasing transporter permease subunit [Alphaproteobacteria bacterium]